LKYPPTGHEPGADLFDGGVAFRPRKSYHEAVFPLGKG
jgi:hypothetical protein